MSKILRDLLGAEEPLFSMTLSDLERASGERGVDVKLISDISTRFRDALDSLGLDSHDATGNEIFAMLINRIRDDNRRIAEKIGVTDLDDATLVIPSAVKTAQKSRLAKNNYYLKHSVAKQLLRHALPQNLMQHLGYRSVDSMLRHENINEIFAAIRLCEGEEWFTKYLVELAKVTSSDFEIRDTEITVLEGEKYADLAAKYAVKNSRNVTCVREMGVVATWPGDKNSTLSTLAWLYHCLNMTKSYSAFCKLKQVVPDFARNVSDALTIEPTMAKIAGHDVKWRVVQRHFAVCPLDDYPDDFRPHVQPDDLTWRSAAESLAELDPEMKFWADLNWVGHMFDHAPLSLNLMDVLMAFAHSDTYDARRYVNFREDLMDEIWLRYLTHQPATCVSSGIGCGI